MQTIYQQLEEKCLPLITSYRDDLIKHDYATIVTECPGVPFIHSTRDCGTHMALLQPADTYPPEGKQVPYLFATADRWHMLKEASVIVDHGIKENNVLLWHYYDGRKLRQITAEKAKQLVTEYQRHVKRQWCNELAARC